MSGGMKVTISHSTYWAKPCWGNSPAVQNSNHQHVCFRGLILYGRLVVGKNQGAPCVPFLLCQVAATHLCSPYSPPLPTQTKLKATLGFVFLLLVFFFPARGLNLLSPSWERSVTAAITGWPGCHVHDALFITRLEDIVAMRMRPLR